MEAATLITFCLLVVASVALGVTVLVPLVAGLVLFALYAHTRHNSWRDIGRMTTEGLRTVKNVVIVMALVGMLTASWRDAGTIPIIVTWASELVRPEFVVVLSFVFNAAVSMLTGTSFGTAATMGVVSMTMCTAAGIDPVIAAGSVLSGIYVGDRWSPISSSALLVSEVTRTHLYGNLRLMARTGIVPIALTAVIYLLIGHAPSGVAEGANLAGIFSSSFDMGWPCIVPAIVVIVLPLLRINVAVTMGVSIAVACIVSLAVQSTAPIDVLANLIMGYHASSPAVAIYLDGGGLTSMLEVIGIIIVTATYAGIFQETQLLDGIRSVIARICERTTPFVGVLAASSITCMICCNQTLPTILSAQLCRGTQPDQDLAVDLEDTNIVIAPLVPWSIASTVPLAAIGGPMAAIAAACYLYLQPLCSLVRSLVRKRRAGSIDAERIEHH